MIDSLLSETAKDNVAATRHLHGRLMIVAVAALTIITGAFAWRTIARVPPTIAPPMTLPMTKAAPTTINPVMDELVETTKALETSQQQVIDQLQILQQLLASQRAEAKKSSAEVAALSGKLEALRESFASLPAPSTEEADATQRRKSKPAASRSRGRAHRIASGRSTATKTHH
jgi:hypothetical protein